MDFSIVVPFHNAEEWLDRTIPALLDQRYPSDRYEIIMIDNNSTDAGPSVVASYRQINLLCEERPGAYAARNRGLARARGRIVAFTDPDCIPHPDWLHKLADAMDADDVGIVLGAVLPGRNTACLRLITDYEHAKHLYVFSSSDPALYFGHTNNMAVRREIFDEVGTFDLLMRGADTLFVQRVVHALSCTSVRYCDRARVRHLQIRSVRDYWGKLAIYARSARRHAGLSPLRPLSNRERFRIVRQLIRQEKHDWPRAMLLLIILGLGWVYWETGKCCPRRKAQPMLAEDGPGASTTEDPPRIT